MVLHRSDRLFADLLLNLSVRFNREIQCSGEVKCFFEIHEGHGRTFFELQTGLEEGLFENIPFVLRTFMFPSPFFSRGVYKGSLVFRVAPCSHSCVCINGTHSCPASQQLGCSLMTRNSSRFGYRC